MKRAASTRGAGLLPAPPAPKRPARLLTFPPAPTAPLPFVLVNMAMTADGKIATANRRISSFGSAHDLAQLYALRATVDAILCGAGTLKAEGAKLDPGPARYRRQRLRRGLPEWPLRVAVSGSASLSPDAALFRCGDSPVLLLATARAPRSRLEGLAAVADEVWLGGEQEVDLRGALARLHREWKVQRLLCEGGAALNAGLFRAGLVNELHLTLCPFLFGGREAPTLADGQGVAKLTEGCQLRLKSQRRQDDELFLVYEAIPA